MVITVAFEDGAPGGNWTAGTYCAGNTLDGAYTFKFYHLKAGSLLVSAGQTVDVGTILGIEGATGNTFGQHLHFEAYQGAHTNPWPPPYGNPIDPLPILRNNGVTI
jgi:murein DD-endopeptidase MepM/ murein hydrolase activator NlpD